MLRATPKRLQVSLKCSPIRVPNVRPKRNCFGISARDFSRQAYPKSDEIDQTSTSANRSFGLRPAGKEPWRSNDARFDESPTPRFGAPAPEKNPAGQPENEEPLRIPPSASPVLEIINLATTVKREQLREWCSEFGIVSEISFPMKNPTYCRIRFDSVEAAVRARNSLSQRKIFLHELPIMRFGKDTGQKYLFIPYFKGTKEALEELISPFEGAIVHIVPRQLSDNQLRIDAYLSFMTPEESAKARVVLQAHDFTGSGSKTAVHVVDSSRYYQATSPGQDGPSMSEFISGPTNPPNRASFMEKEPSNTLFLGNIPTELLYNKSEIIQKFSKYGPLADVRIPDAGNKPRGYLYLEYHRQEDAAEAHRDLTTNPLFLFSRRVRVDYAAPLAKSGAEKLESMPQDQLSDRCLYITDFPLDLLRNPRKLMDHIADQFGEVVDLRIPKADRVPTGVIFLDFTRAESAQAMLDAMKRMEETPLGSGAQARFAQKGKAPQWSELDHPPTDTLRLWNLPAKAILGASMLYEAFGSQPGLLDIRIPKMENFPMGTAFLQYASIDAAKDAFGWIRSDPDNPITFFGREVRAHFAEGLRNNRTSVRREPLPTKLWHEEEGGDQDAQRKTEFSRWAWGLKPSSSPRDEGSG